MRSDAKNSVKGLVLTSVFMECYLRGRELAVSGLLESHPILHSHYGRRPHVLSNVLGRYGKLGLLYREKDYVRGHPYRYNLTEKGFKRLSWMVQNRERYLFCGADLLGPLRQGLIYVREKGILELKLRNTRNLRDQLAARGRVGDSAAVEAHVQSMESSLKAGYNEAKLSQILTMLREEHKVLHQKLDLR
jgi:hypothetical protein